MADYDAKPREIRNFALVQLGLVTVFLLALVLMFDGIDADPPPWWQWVVLLAGVGVAAFFAERVWLSSTPLPSDAEDPTAAALGIFAGQLVRKLFICEAAILLGILFAFFTDHAAWPILIAGVPGLALLAFEIWPSDRNISLTETMLDSDGATSGLLASFDA